MSNNSYWVQWKKIHLRLICSNHCSSHTTYQITYTSSLFVQNELELLENTTQQGHIFLDSLRHSGNPFTRGLPQAQCLTHLVTHPKKNLMFHPDKQKINQMEIDKLLAVKFVREFKYPNWLANMVVVPKKKGKWWVYVDYTNLNDTCPKDNFSLPRIDQIVEATIRHGMLSILDSFFGYH